LQRIEERLAILEADLEDAGNKVTDLHRVSVGTGESRSGTPGKPGTDVPTLKNLLAQRTEALNRERERADSIETQLQMQISNNKNLELKWSRMSNTFASLEQRFNSLAEDLSQSRREIQALHRRLLDAGAKLSEAQKERDAARDELGRLKKKYGED
jgi:DNA repair exonuclease SbcCD ATPase subunit